MPGNKESYCLPAQIVPRTSFLSPLRSTSPDSIFLGPMIWSPKGHYPLSCQVFSDTISWYTEQICLVQCRNLTPFTEILNNLCGLPNRTYCNSPSSGWLLSPRAKWWWASVVASSVHREKWVEIFCMWWRASSQSIPWLLTRKRANLIKTNTEVWKNNGQKKFQASWLSLLSKTIPRDCGLSKFFFFFLSNRMFLFILRISF